MFGLLHLYPWEKTKETESQQDGDSIGKDIADSAAWALVALSAFERSTPQKYRLPVAGALGQVCGLSPSSRGIVQKDTSEKSKLAHKQIRMEHEDDFLPSHFQKPDVVPLGKKKGTRLTNKEVKRRTGFATERELLAFIIIVCDGDLNVIKKICSTLTWFEECFFMLSS